MVKKKRDLGDMVWVKYGGLYGTINEYPAFLVTGNDPEKVRDEETGAMLVQVEWNTGYNSRDWVREDDILPKSNITNGDVGRGQRAKRTPQQATAQKEEEMAAFLAARRPPPPPHVVAKKNNKKPPPVPSSSGGGRDQSKKTSSIRTMSSTLSSSAPEGEAHDDDVVDLCSNTYSDKSSNSEEEEDDDDEVEYIETRGGTRLKPPGVVEIIEPVGLYHPRFHDNDDDDDNDDDESEVGDDNDMNIDNEQEENDDDSSNESLVSASDTEEEENDFRKGIVQQTTKVYENAPPGTMLQTIIEKVHAEMGIKEVTFDSYTSIAKQVVVLMKRSSRPTGPPAEV